MYLDIVPGKLFVVRKKTNSLVLDDDQNIVKFVSLEKGTTLLALSIPFKRYFSDDKIVVKKPGKDVHDLHISNHNSEGVMCTTKFLFEDKIVELGSVKYFIMRDYMAELSSTIAPLKDPNR